jgi:hypothetical protein
MDRIEIIFLDGVLNIQNCWVNLYNNDFYQYRADCQVKRVTSSPSIILYNFNDINGRVINGLTVFI